MPFPGKVFLVPTVLAEDAEQTVPAYVLDAVKQCGVFFVENERTTRRWLKKIWREMVIDAYEWVVIHKAEEDVITHFRNALKAGKNIGIISEAGCPGIADPGQILVAEAQAMGVAVVPLVGPSSILLALMASGMNGQQFRFRGYLPIESASRIKMLRQLELEAVKESCTQLFIETPYRNNQLLKDILATCQGSTKLCVAADITAANEYIVTKTISDWKKQPLPELHKRPTIYLIGK
ncbi:SAM-dependent methyltransferase [Parasegetibacter sp. NRK P23]|uniref:SAM-dependent methyltransferase n=1 Tax=Parasegetibacter sp. NRK P23 TaxID=2942999 RepID=UPI00204412AC|nr:SAM-dependent methyltransferase [Parasegetibacter sp. NRK P23]MCM5527695.1 SAM-dependent methyltransferase [Parasegetibacter sp. NRK P23]